MHGNNVTDKLMGPGLITDITSTCISCLNRNAQKREIRFEEDLDSASKRTLLKLNQKLPITLSKILK